MPNYCRPERNRSALITISAQRDFAREDSPIKACGLGRALPAMESVVRAFRAENAPIFHSVRLYRADGSNVESCRREAVEEGLRILMPGSLGSELIDGIKPDPSLRLEPDCLFTGAFQELGGNEWAFYRPRWGAFHNTDLEARLRALDVSTVVICGFSFTTGTRATVYEASTRDFRGVLVTDAVCGASEQGLRELGRLGTYLMTSDGIRPWLTGTAQHSLAG
ncbi:MAG: isochorismatase family cysteine hydrolase [Kiloniellales bacterium]